MPGSLGPDDDRLFLGESELADQMKRLDWAATPLGPSDRWPESLRTSVRIMLASQQPIWIGWGRDLTCLYNDACKSILGDRHPWALGRPARDVWREIREIGPMLDAAMAGDACIPVEVRLPMVEHSGALKETYGTLSCSPIPDDDGTVGGVFCTSTDVTRRVVGARQDALLRELAAGTAGARSRREACEHSARALATDPHDLPFALIYTIEPGERTATLVSCSGIAPDHRAAPASQPLDAAGPWPFAALRAGHGAQFVDDLPARFPGSLPTGAWDRPPTSAAVLPIAAAGEAGHSGFLVVGLNPFRPFDDDYRGFLTLAAGQIASAIAKAEAREGERRHAETLADLNRVGSAVAAELDLERAVQIVTDAATSLSGAAFGAFFYNATDDKGGSYTLYTLSGAPREAFAKFPMPRNTAVFAPTFNGEATVRSGDITRDPRFGRNEPHRGMPEGHLSVRSYLATPVVSRTGAVLGGLFFGHPGIGMFDARAEHIVETIAGQAAIAIDRAQLYRSAQREIDHRRRVEEELRASGQDLELEVAERTAELLREARERSRVERSFQHLVEGVADYALFMLDARGIVSTWNTGAQRIKGYDASEIVGQHFERFYTAAERATGLPAQALETALREGKFEAEGRRVRKDGTEFWASVVINPMRDVDGKVVGFAKITRDITERKQAADALATAQGQLAQSQKMEGIGQLTGGVAHDFNNLLTVILGNLESLQRTMQGTEPSRERMMHSIDNAMRGAQRAAALTQRLLAFSRRQPLDPKPVDASRLVSGMSELLRRTLGEQIGIETVLAGGLWRVFADPNQLEVSLLNLAVNARDAMPDGGKLTIEIANAHLDENYAATHAEVVPGQYVVICISDTGAGMSPEVQAHAFEPFFTTKEIGHGTGLGLSQVYGFVKQSGGHVKLYSEPGLGTTVKLYLPRLHSEDAAAEMPEHPTHAPPSASGETILVVEDDPDVRANTTSTLRELRYTVLEAPNGATALRLLRRHAEIALLFTDVGLPGGMNGRQLADAARGLRPDLKVLFTTGYARNAIVHDGRLDPGVVMLSKPFTFTALATKISEMLETKQSPPCVLLVEDEVLVQMVAKEQIAELGYRVEAASTATDALNRARLLAGKIDIAVVDIGLPDMKGDALVKELRALYPGLGIIVASGYGQSDLRTRFDNDVSIGFVSKPYTQADLRQALDRVRGLQT